MKPIYLSHAWLDISFVVSVVSQFMHNPNKEHLKAVFGKNEHLLVEAYTNVDWVDSLTDQRSTSNYCTLVGINLVTWKSKTKFGCPEQCKS